MSTFHSFWRGPPSGVSLALAVLLMATVLCGAASAAVLVLPLGDSTTHGGDFGYGVHPSYRYYLAQDLAALGYSGDFVGTVHDPYLGGIDPDNEGHNGHTAAEIRAGLSGWLGAYAPPNVALVHTGTGDAIEAVPTSQSIADITAIIAKLRARNPSITILVAQIIPTMNAPTNTRVVALNQAIAGLASLSTVQSRVIIVDQFSGYDGVADNQPDGVHPDTTGEKKMAARWKAALIPVLSGTTPPQDVTPPASVTNLQVAATTSTSITWTWTDPTDADFAKVSVYKNGVYVTDVAEGVRTCTLTGLAPATSYILGTRTYDTTGNGNTAIVGTAGTTAASEDTTPPGTITNLQVATRTSSSITWTWTDPTNADFAKVEVTINGVNRGYVAKGVRTYTMTGLTPSTAYQLSARTLDLAGNCNPTAITSTTTPLSGDTTPPASVKYLKVSARTATSITWTWTDPTDADFAKVSVYKNGVYVTEVPKGVRTYTLTGLMASTSFTLGTRTYDTAGNGNPAVVSSTGYTTRFKLTSSRAYR